ncbi:hypothetical protein J120_03645 [candidate division TM6 bacterium JCVI TM6SC1]|uniref:Uncharacterized protein n=1 Tax=candidate division TM6 bacterium JCVI TM6SC1 TaxID=1306947 RepID=A0A0D2GNP3_9BACT|nr:hypothetical protein J120_03645 [candidate division TM6 bacterium JCVI TM6SC1]
MTRLHYIILVSLCIAVAAYIAIYQYPLRAYYWFDASAEGLSVPKGINAGLDINARSKEGLTGLMIASARGNYPVAQELVARGAYLDARSWDQDRNTALHYAIYNANLAQSLSIIPLLIANGADVRSANAHGDQPLHYTGMIERMNERMSVIELLVRAGADINAPNRDGNTIVHIAVEMLDNYFITALRTVFGSILNMSATNRLGLTPLELAYQQGQYGELTMEESLLKPITPLSIAPPLIAAIMRGESTDSLGTLSAESANIPDSSGRYPLSYALRSSAPVPWTAALLSAGAQTARIDQSGNTVLHDAVRYVKSTDDVRAIIDLALRAGADPLAVDIRGDTVLHVAVRTYRLPIVEFFARTYPLLKSTPNRFGARPADLAALIARSVPGAAQLISALE